MKEPDYWEQFLNTGKIDDYLHFKGKETGPETDGSGREAGDNPYAGIGETNRDGFKDGAYRGIR